MPEQLIKRLLKEGRLRQGTKYRHLTAHFETMRRKRNEMTYEAGALLSLSEAHKAFEDAVELVQQILKQVKAKNPQMDLGFD